MKSSSAIYGENEPSKLGDVTTLKVALALLLVGTHGLTYLHEVDSSKTHLLPAVPVFMFLSGYFMMANYKRSPYPIHFMILRYLKLLPIMIVSLVATFALLLLYDGWPMPHFVVAEVPQFLIAHLTVLQSFIPSGFEASGAPVRNGALWFIEAILILYASLPLIAFIERRVKGFLVILSVASAGFSVLLPAYSHSVGGLREAAEIVLGAPVDDILPPLVEHLFGIGLRVASSAWMFYAGCLIRRHHAWFLSSGIARILVGISVVVTLSFYLAGLGEWNHYGPTPPWYLPGYIAAWIAVHKCFLQRFSVPPISIGLYVWHVPVFHAMNHLDLDQLWLAAPLVVALAWASLHLIERPVGHLISAYPPTGDRIAKL